MSDRNNPRGENPRRGAREGTPPDNAPGQTARPETQEAGKPTAAETRRGAGIEREPQARAGPSSGNAHAACDGPLECAIEAERLRLLQARAVLKCLYEVLLYRDDEESVVHAETVDVAVTLLSECIDRLDRVRLRPLFEAQVRSRPHAARDAGVPHNKVEDAPPRYLC